MREEQGFEIKKWKCGKCGEEDDYFIKVDRIHHYIGHGPNTYNGPEWADATNGANAYWCLPCVLLIATRKLAENMKKERAH